MLGLEHGGEGWKQFLSGLSRNGKRGIKNIENKQLLRNSVAEKWSLLGAAGKDPVEAKFILGRKGNNAEQDLLSRRDQHAAGGGLGEALGTGEKRMAPTHDRQVCRYVSLLREARSSMEGKRGLEEQQQSDDLGEVGMTAGARRAQSGEA